MTRTQILARLALGLVCVRVVLAEPGMPLTSNSVPAGLPGVSAGIGSTPKPTPALPGTKTAADTFRELLAMSVTERAQALANRSEYNRKYLEDRLREYEALPPDQRELRLKQLELNCHLPDLMKLAPTNRARRLSLVPPNLRPLIEERLQEWDLLPANVQRDVFEHQTTANFFLRVRPSGAAPTPNPAALTLPPLPGTEESTRDLESFNHFIELPTREQEKTLDALPVNEREDMEKTLQAFAKLPAQQRQTCIDSFLKFRRMTPEQRNQFLKNAERWKSLSSAERETWRTLVKILPATPPPASPPPFPRVSELPLPPATASNQTGLGAGEK